MAIRVAVVVTDNDGVMKITWTGLRNGDTGAPVKAGRFADKTAAVIQDAAGSGDAVLIEGSQDGGTTWGGLHDPQGVLLNGTGNFESTTIEDPIVISESPLEMRPRVSGGDGTTDLTVIITMPTRGK